MGEQQQVSEALRACGEQQQQGGGRVLVGVGYVDWLCHGPMLDWIRNVCTIAMKSFAVALDGDLEVART